ncbi:putative Striatin-3 isoform 1 protein [Naja naja]|nr:putative Striatin-3 isoform 1 protein [Naja naja]
MDEHPGAGGGIMAGATPRPQQQPLPPIGGNVNSQLLNQGCAGSNSGGGGSLPSQQQSQGPAAVQEAAGPGSGSELSRPQHYTIPGILHYIQHEWARFEMERAHWEVERAELQVR